MSERAYQAPLLSALLLDGYKIWHSTSHNGLEFGKDIIVSKGRQLIALQLKGNPGARYGIGDWHKELNQVIQLVEMPIASAIAPSAKNRRHQSILVTNGHVHEAVYVAVQQFNERSRRSRESGSLAIWGRGELLELLTKHSESIWPTTIGAQRTILGMMSATGLDPVDAERFSAALAETLRWGERASRRAARERAIGAMLITDVMLGRWREVGNLFEAVRMGVASTIMVVGYLTEQGATKGDCGAIVERASGQIREEAEAIAKRVVTRPLQPLTDGNVLDEFAFFHQRKIMLVGIASVFAIWAGDSSDELIGSIKTYIREIELFPFLDGEHVVPAAISLIWALTIFDPTKKSEEWLYVLLRDLILHCLSPNAEENLPGPYFGIEDVARWKYRRFLGQQFSKLDSEGFRFRSAFARILLILLVRRNEKSRAKELYSRLTHILGIETRLNNINEFGWARVDDALEIEVALKSKQRWDDVVREARLWRDPPLPGVLRDAPHIVALHCIFFPYRATADVMLWLDAVFCSTWFRPKPP